MASASRNLRFDPLGNDNISYTTWIEKVQDLLYDKGLESIYEASETDRGTVQIIPERKDNSPKEAVLESTNRKVFTLIREHLDPDMYQTTVPIKRGDTVGLLRMLRKNFIDDTPIDREELRERFDKFKLADYGSYTQYVNAFTAHVALMRRNGIKSVDDEGHVALRFKNGLPPDYDQLKTALLASETTAKARVSLAEMITFFKTASRTDGNLPGSIAPGAATTTKSRDATYSASVAGLACQTFVRTGECPRENCPFKHIRSSPGQPSDRDFPPTSRFEGTCNYCKKPGHKLSDCQKLKNKEARLEEERKAKDEAKTVVESSSVAISVPSEPIYFGNSVY